MKKVVYVLLLLAELVLDGMMLSILWNSSLYLAVAAIVAVWAVLLGRLIPKLKKADDEAVKRKLYRRLALVMAVPLLTFVILVIGFAIRFTMVN